MLRNSLRTLAVSLALLGGPVLAQRGFHGGDGTSGMLDALDIGGPSGSGAYGYPSTVPFDRAFDAPPAPSNAAAPSDTVTPKPECRDFSGDATTDATGAPFRGRACLGADGKWHIAN